MIDRFPLKFRASVVIKSSRRGGRGVVGMEGAKAKRMFTGKSLNITTAYYC